MTKVTKNIFPKKFYWGVSTASHQVEGGCDNQWTVWELAHASELAKTAPHRLDWLPDWEKVKTQATTPANYVSGHGIGHYKHYKSDFELAESLNFNAFRFGIEWSRIEPEAGQWNEAAIQHYRDYIAELKKQGMEPFLNLWHWTLPTWFADKGGFKKRTNLADWKRFVQKIADEFADSVQFCITLNEPNVYASFGYLNGQWPPQEKSWLSFIRVYVNLVSAHRQAYRILKHKNPHLQVGVAAQLANIQAKRPHNVLDEVSTKLMRYFWNWWFLRRIRKQQDFVGFNYYFTDYYTGLFKRENPRLPVNDLGWYMEPEGLYPLLLRTWIRYKKPIFITENGVADESDQYRQWWIEETIVAMERALSEGVDLRGYFHWSLLDNFEWSYGWWPKFGLVAVERGDNMTRRVRPSAKWFADKIKRLEHAGNVIDKN